MLLGIACFIAFCGIIPFFHKETPPLVMETTIVNTTPALPRCMIREETLTVFIHGSIHVPLAFLSPICVLSDSFNGTSWYEKTVQSIRYHTTTQQGGVVLTDGLFEVTQLMNLDNFEEPIRYNGACHVIRSFKRSCNSDQHSIHRFFNFGWSGILSEQERKSAAKKLYDALYNLKTEATLQGRNVKIELYAFSHGGQVALHLPVIRKAQGHKDFIIDLVVLSAVPLWQHNTKNILSGMFTTVINCYSPGDFAQTIDRFSTPQAPHQAISETIPVPCKRSSSLTIVDVAITLGNRYIIPHCAFFNLDKLHILPFRVRRSEGCRTRYEGAHKFVELLNPLPLVSIYPYILEPILAYVQTNDRTYNHVDLDLQGTNDTFCGTYTFSDNTQVKFSWPIPSSLAASQQELKDALQEQALPNKISILWHETLHALSAFWKN